MSSPDHTPPARTIRSHDTNSRSFMLPYSQYRTSTMIERLTLIEERLAARIPPHGVRVEGDAEAGGGGDGEHAVRVQLPRLRDDGVHIGRAGDVFDEIGVGKSGGEVEVRRQTDRHVPAVRDEADAVLLRHPADAPLLRDAADLRHIRLDDVERARLDP